MTPDPNIKQELDLASNRREDLEAHDTLGEAWELLRTLPAEEARRAALLQLVKAKQASLPEAEFRAWFHASVQRDRIGRAVDVTCRRSNRRRKHRQRDDRTSRPRRYDGRVALWRRSTGLWV